MFRGYAGVRLAVYTVRDVFDAGTAALIWRLLEKHGFKLRKLSHLTRPFADFTESAFKELWTGAGYPGGFSGSYWIATLIATGTGGSEFSLRWEAVAARHSAFPLSLTIDIYPGLRPVVSRSNRQKELNRLVMLGQDMCRLLDATFGYVTPLPDRRAADRMSLQVPRLDTCLPDIYWTTFVGPPWAAVVRDRAKAATGIVQNETDGLLVLQADTTSWSGMVPDSSFMKAVRQAAGASLLLPGSLPAVSFDALRQRADSVLESPVEARSIGYRPAWRVYRWIMR